MNRGQSIAALLAGASMLAGCDTAPNIRLYNGVGRALDLQITKGADDSRHAQLAAGGSARIWNIYGPDFRLTTEGCDRRYSLPYMTWNYPWRRRDDSEPDYEYPYPVKVQLAPDFTLYLMPHRAKAPIPLEGIREVQAHGYPLRPTSVTCR